MAMYQVFIDKNLMNNDNIPNLMIYNPVLSLEQNAISKFEFQIQNTHPIFNQIHKLTSLVEVYQESELIFRGRVIEDGDDTYKTREIYCEDELAFFIDSIQNPYNYSGSLQGFIELLLNTHNSQVEDYKKFKLGTITVTDPNDYITRADTQYLDTWTTIKQKLIELLGGYIQIRHEEDGFYFDYLSDFTTLNSQEVIFGENMLTVTKNQSASGIFTVVIPLGARNEETGERLTIAEVNGGKNYIESPEGIELYGRITQVATYDDVTLPENLVLRGQQLLNESILMTLSIEINAVDMASIQRDIHAFRLHSKIHVVSEFHDIDDYFVPLKLTVYLFKPENNRIVLNSVQKTLTDDSNANDVNVGQVVEVIGNIQNDYLINIPNQIIETQKELTSQIEQTAVSINQEVSEKYSTKDEVTQLISEVSTSFEQTKDSFEFQFNTFTQDLEDLLNGTNANFEDIRKYIRFENGDIILGQVGNEFSLRISKEKISFMQGVQEVAYVSNSRIYITTAEIITNMQIGNFAWLPRENGNLTFKKR